MADSDGKNVADALEHLEANGFTDDVIAKIAALTPEEKKTFFNQYINGKTPEEIAREITEEARRNQVRAHLNEFKAEADRAPEPEANAQDTTQQAGAVDVSKTPETEAGKLLSSMDGSTGQGRDGLVSFGGKNAEFESFIANNGGIANVVKTLDANGDGLDMGDLKAALGDSTLNSQAVGGVDAAALALKKALANHGVQVADARGPMTGEGAPVPNGTGARPGAGHGAAKTNVAP